MTDGEFQGVLDKVEGLPGGQDVLLRIIDAHTQAGNFWRLDRSAGRVSSAGISAAQRAAMQLSLISDGVLHLLGRAPATAEFGVLSRTAA